MPKKLIPIMLLSLTFITLAAEPAHAGPGGMIAVAAISTTWGRVLLGLFLLLFLPLIILLTIQEKRAERRTLKDLHFMSEHHPEFHWPRIRERAQDCFFRIHAAWSREDLSQASAYMTDWYWQNQQLAIIDRWQREGLINHCHIQRLSGIRPLLFLHRNQNAAHEDSLLVLSIRARLQDYLADRESGKVIEGCKKYKEVETIWSFRMQEGRWQVANIEADGCALDYLKMLKQVPAIETTLENRFKA